MQKIPSSSTLLPRCNLSATPCIYLIPHCVISRGQISLCFGAFLAFEIMPNRDHAFYRRPDSAPVRYWYINSPLGALMRTTLKMVLPLIVSVAAVSLLFTAYQVRTQRRALRDDLSRRAEILGESLQETIEPIFDRGADETLHRIVTPYRQS